MARLADGSRVVVVGAGPSGGFFACMLLDRCRQAGIAVDLTLLDRKDFGMPGRAGCSMCAGALSDSLLKAMGEIGLHLPEAVVQRKIHGYRFETAVAGLDLDAPEGTTIYTAFRGRAPGTASYPLVPLRGTLPLPRREGETAPHPPAPLSAGGEGETETTNDERHGNWLRGLPAHAGLQGDEMGFDEFLLGEAMARGAKHLAVAVTGIARDSTGEAKWVLQCQGGHGAASEEVWADLLVIACGVHGSLLSVVEKLGVGYMAPRLAKSCQAEIALDPEFITERFEDRIHVFFPGDPDIEFVAATPKKRHVTITMVGAAAERGHLTQMLAGTMPVTHATRGRPAKTLRDYMPADWHPAGRYCQCLPMIPVSIARHPCADGLVVVGDACAQRYLKNGLYSALLTAQMAARAIAEHGTSASALRRHFGGPCRRMYVLDNLCGRIIFRWNRLVTKIPFLARAHFRVAWEEQHLRPDERHVVTRILWNIFTGNVRYIEILMDTICPAAVWAIAKGTMGEMWDRVRGR